MVRLHPHCMKIAQRSLWQLCGTTVLLAGPSLAWAQAATPSPAPAAAAAPVTEAPKVQSSLAKIRDTGVVAIAYRPDAVPFAYLDENKQPIGYGIEICREIVRLMERELKKPLRIVFVEVNAKTRFDAVNSGKADMECGTTINDAQRRKIADYSMPYQ